MKLVNVIYEYTMCIIHFQNYVYIRIKNILAQYIHEWCIHSMYNI